MTDTVTLPPGVEVEFTGTTALDAADLEDLRGVVRVVGTDDSVERVEIDLDELLRMAAKHSSLATRYGWRRASRSTDGFDE